MIVTELSLEPEKMDGRGVIALIPDLPPLVLASAYCHRNFDLLIFR